MPDVGVSLIQIPKMLNSTYLKITYAILRKIIYLLCLSLSVIGMYLILCTINLQNYFPLNGILLNNIVSVICKTFTIYYIIRKRFV